VSWNSCMVLRIIVPSSSLAADLTGRYGKTAS
jgi:hypothetical protein